jgi:hypothetical protein
LGYVRANTVRPRRRTPPSARTQSAIRADRLRTDADAKTKKNKLFIYLFILVVVAVFKREKNISVFNP